MGRCAGGVRRVLCDHESLPTSTRCVEHVGQLEIRDTFALVNEASAALTRTCDGGCGAARSSGESVQFDDGGAAYIECDCGTLTLTYCWCGGKLEAPGG